MDDHLEIMIFFLIFLILLNSLNSLISLMELHKTPNDLLFSLVILKYIEIKR